MHILKICDGAFLYLDLLSFFVLFSAQNGSTSWSYYYQVIVFHYIHAILINDFFDHVYTDYRRSNKKEINVEEMLKTIVIRADQAMSTRLLSYKFQGWRKGIILMFLEIYVPSALCSWSLMLLWFRVRP